MKLVRYTKGRSTTAKEIGEGLLIAVLSLLGACLLGALILMLLDRPLTALAAATLIIFVITGGIGGLLGRGKRWIGSVTLVALLCICSIVLTKGRLPFGVLLGYGVYLASYLLSSLIPKQKFKRKRHYK